MSQDIVNAGTEGGYCNNQSGLYNAINDDYRSSESSSSEFSRNEAHIWFDTSAVGPDFASWTRVQLSLNVTELVTPLGGGYFLPQSGANAGATFDYTDCGIGGGGYQVLDFPLSTGVWTFDILSGGWARSNIFHLSLWCQVYGDDPGGIKFSYTPKPYLTIDWGVVPAKGGTLTMMGVG